MMNTLVILTILSLTLGNVIVTNIIKHSHPKKTVKFVSAHLSLVPFIPLSWLFILVSDISSIFAITITAICVFLYAFTLYGYLKDSNNNSTESQD